MGRNGGWKERHTLQMLRGRCGGRCWLCQQPCTLEDASRDHVIPVSMGGANTWVNMRLAHIACNTARGGAFPASYISSALGKLTKKGQRRVWAECNGRCTGCEANTGLMFHRVPGGRWYVICTSCSTRDLMVANARRIWCKPPVKQAA